MNKYILEESGKNERYIQSEALEISYDDIAVFGIDFWSGGMCKEQ